jgi:hypothetical protein
MNPKKPAARRRKKADPLRGDFGPGVAEESGASAAGADAPADRPLGSIPCAGEGCFLRPFANLALRFAPRIVTGHGPSLGRAAGSGLEMMKALRDFLDEEIALAEGRGRGDARKVTKIPLD